jgi:hypothetical protein
MHLKFLTATALALAMTAPATANTFHADSASQPLGYEVVNISNPAVGGVRSGEIQLTNNTTHQSLLVWCLDLIHYLATPTDYNIVSYTPGTFLNGVGGQTLDSVQTQQIASLIFNGLSLGGGFSADDRNAATQLAIWRVEYGASFSTDAAGTLATAFAAEFNAAVNCPNCVLNILIPTDATNNQILAYVTTAAVPGPIAGAGFPGLMAAMVSLWGLAKRRRNKRLNQGELA